MLDALATLSFDYPSPLPPGARDRSPFFREELRQFLILTRENGLDPMSMKGSYAGAIGSGQFMPAVGAATRSTSTATATWTWSTAPSTRSAPWPTS